MVSLYREQTRDNIKILDSASLSAIVVRVTRITEIPEYYRNTGIPVKNIGIPMKDAY